MDFKTTKKELDTIFAKIKNNTSEGILPDLEDVNVFARLSQRMHQLADEDVMQEAEDFSHLAGQLLASVKKGDVEDSVMLVESLEDALSYCQSEFKI